MYPLILCFSCGRSLGDLYDAFLAAKRAELNKHISGMPNAFEIMAKEIQLGHILDALRLSRECCRVHMLTQAEFKDYY